MGTAKRERQKQGRAARIAEAQAAQERKKRFKVIRNFAILGVLVVGLLFLLSRGGDDDDVTAGAPTTVAGTDGTATTATTVEGSDTTLEGSATTASTVAPEPVEFAYGTGPCPAADGSSPRTVTFDAAPQLCVDPAKTYTATLATTEGEVVIELDTATTPGTVNNFVTLSRYHFYDGTDLFRTDPSIGIIQGGSPTSQSPSDPGPGYDLPDEGFDFAAIGGQGGPYTYEAGDLVMARTASPNGAGAQFFLCVTDACSGLDGQGVYVEFGHVTSGLDVLEAILELHEPGGSLGGAPSRQVTVETVTIAET
ncbi:MAG: peptidylprolyl isomerase [Acidimicrobiia bacterium]|nr:peptidylprolyl isomerase [Acidimicrobiia bacterium]